MPARILTRDETTGKLKPTVRRDQFRGVIDLVRARGLLGHQFDILFPGWDAAEDFKRGINLSARYYCSCGEKLCSRKHPFASGGCPVGGQRISCHVIIVKAPGTGKPVVHLTLQDKLDGWRNHIARYGTDRSNWPYDPMAKRKKARQ